MSGLDTSPDLPVVAGWRQVGTEFVKVGRVAYTSLRYTPTWQDAGSWSITAPFGNAAPLVPGNLVTIDWRGTRSTWLLDQPKISKGDDDGSPVVTASGVGAKTLLGRCLAWPDGTQPLVAQPIYLDERRAPFVGPAETILRTLVAVNFRDRYGAPIKIPASMGRGATIRVRPKFDNLFELVQRYAQSAGIGFDVGLEDTSGTRAQLWLRFSEPTDRSRTVRLTTRLGTVAGWEQTSTAPTATRALVSYGPSPAQVQTKLAADVTVGATTVTVASSDGFPTPGGDTPAFRVVIGDETLRVTAVAGKVWTVARGVGATSPSTHSAEDAVRMTRYYTEVTTPESNEIAAEWGGAREVFVQGPDNLDADEINDAALAAIAAGTDTRTLSVTAVEAKGVRAFQHYDVGDVATAELLSGATDVTSISAIEVTVGSDGVSVSPTLGNPANANSALRLAQILRALGRAVRQERTNRA